MDFREPLSFRFSGKQVLMSFFFNALSLYFNSEKEGMEKHNLILLQVTMNNDGVLFVCSWGFFL